MVEKAHASVFWELGHLWSWDVGARPALASHCRLLGKLHMEPGGAGSELFVVMARMGWEGQEVTMAAKSPPATSDFRGGWGPRPRLQGHMD